MPIDFSCSQCGRKFRVGDHLAGKAGRCPQCQAVIQIPAAPTAGAATPPTPAAAPRPVPISPSRPAATPRPTPVSPPLPVAGPASRPASRASSAPAVPQAYPVQGVSPMPAAPPPLPVPDGAITLAEGGVSGGDQEISGWETRRREKAKLTMQSFLMIVAALILNSIVFLAFLVSMVSVQNRTDLGKIAMLVLAAFFIGNLLFIVGIRQGAIAKGQSGNWWIMGTVPILAAIFSFILARKGVTLPPFWGYLFLAYPLLELIVLTLLPDKNLIPKEMKEADPM